MSNGPWGSEADVLRKRVADLERRLAELVKQRAVWLVSSEASALNELRQRAEHAERRRDEALRTMEGGE